MKILVAGCSFASELSAIIDIHYPGHDVANVAYPAAGNRFIADSVLVETIKQQFDVVYVSWSGFSRYDVPVTSDNLFLDWMPKGYINSVPYIFTGGIGGWDHHKHQFSNLLFSGIHKFIDHKELHYNSLIEIVKIQGYLRSLNIPFYFTSMINQFKSDPNVMVENTCEYGVSRYPEHQYLIDQIDFSNWIFDEDRALYESSKFKGTLSKDNFHPSMYGYKYWMDLFFSRLKKDKIL